MGIFVERKTGAIYRWNYEDGAEYPADCWRLGSVGETFNGDYSADFDTKCGYAWGNTFDECVELLAERIGGEFASVVDDMGEFAASVMAGSSCE